MIAVFAVCSGMLKLTAINPARQHSNLLSILFCKKFGENVNTTLALVLTPASHFKSYVYIHRVAFGLLAVVDR